MLNCIRIEKGRARTGTGLIYSILSIVRARALCILIFISLFIVTAYQPCGYAQRSGEIIYQIYIKNSGIDCDFHKNSLVMDAMKLWSFGRLVGI